MHCGEILEAACRVLPLTVMVGVLVAGCGSGADPTVMFQNGEYVQALSVFSERAKDGDLEAINYLGIHYYLGAGVSRNFTKAAERFERAALAEYPDAQRNLGVMYLRGLGVRQNYHRAYGWLYRARAGGNQRAAEYLKLMGDNVTPNASINARKWVIDQIRAHRAETTIIRNSREEEI